MTDPKDYQLANRKNRELKLRKQRYDILNSDGQTALSKILDAPAPATLLQSFPDQDLYYLMHKIGPYDFIPLLSLASSDQWEYILDIDVWNEDRLDLDMMTRVFDVLYQADPKRLLRWAITQKPDFLEYYLYKHMDIVIREHDDPPPSDFDDYITLDDKFYFRFPDKPKPAEDNDPEDMPVPGDSQPAWELIEVMIKTLAEMDLSVFHGLLQETTGLLPAETEEEQFRQKTNRLAEKGFLPSHDAVGIYQPARYSDLRQRPQALSLNPDSYDPDIPLPPQFFTGFMEDDNLFIQALKQFDLQASLILESELAALINKVISADKIKLRTREDLEKAISKTLNYLNLGLEIMTGIDSNPGHAQSFIDRHFLEDIFRTGSKAGIELKNKAQQWFAHSFMNAQRLPLQFLGEDYLGVIGGLLIERPMIFDTSGPSNYRDFRSVDDIESTQTALEEIMAVDFILNRMDVNTHSFTQGVLTYKTCILTLWAKDWLDQPGNLESIPVHTFKPFFKAVFGSLNDQNHNGPLSDLTLFIQNRGRLDDHDMSDAVKRVLNALMLELEEEYATVDPDDIDARFIPHFLLT